MNPQAQTIPPHVQVLQLLLGQWVSSAMSTLARLGIPDLVAESPQTAEELAPKVGAQTGPLYRLMRTTASVGILAEGANGKFSATPLSNALRKDATPSFYAMALMNSDEWHTRGWEKLEYSIRTGKQVPESIYGKPLFEYLRDNPEPAANFNAAMTALSIADGPSIVEAYNFSALKSIVDVGGGHGQLLATILGKNPQMTGTLYDAPQVIEGAQSGPLAQMTDRVTFAGGNMFESVPQGSDAYIMKYIIHDWPDEKCIPILENCRKA